MILDFSKAAHLYEQQKIGREMQLGDRPAVIVTDFIYGFTDPNSPIGTNMDVAVGNTKRLLETIRGFQLPIFYTVHGYRADMRDAGIWPKKYPSLNTLIIGSRWTEIDDRVEPQSDEVVLVKQYPSAFFGTSLQSMLVASQIDSLIITGCTTSGCVRASVIDGIQHGFRVFVPEDCVADRDEAPHRANLFDIGTKYADVGSSEALITRLNKAAFAGA
jgi:maleamate amidohydrolase